MRSSNIGGRAGFYRVNKITNITYQLHNICTMFQSSQSIIQCQTWVHPQQNAVTTVHELCLVVTTRASLDGCSLKKYQFENCLNKCSLSDLHSSQYLNWKLCFHARYLILLLFYTFLILSLSAVHEASYGALLQQYKIEKFRKTKGLKSLNTMSLDK